MSRSMVRLMQWPLYAVCALGFVRATQGAPELSAPAKPTVESSRLDRYVKDGTTYFALSLQPAARDKVAAEGHDIVVLFDTSASQTGAYRQKALDVLASFLGTLGPKDRVRLLAADIGAVPMSDAFVAPASAEMKAAIDKLMKRVPLGSTDMGEVLAAAATSFDKNSQAQRAAVYIGDGVNNAGAVSDDLRQALSSLVDGRVATTSYAVGPQLNTPMLAAIANQTGGMMIIDREDSMAKEAGLYLSRVVQEPTVWVESAQLPKAIGEMYPKKMPPLRYDRDTVVIGKGNVSEPFAVAVAGEAAGKPVALKWNVNPGEASDENAYLVSLVEMARPSGGIELPTLGTAGLAEARRVLNGQARELAQLGKQAAASGDKHGAEQLAREALRRDPNNTLAENLVHVAQIDAPSSEALPPPPPEPRPAPQPRDGDLRLVRPAPRPAAEQEDLSFLDTVEHRRALLEQVITQDVNVGLQRARDMMGSNPATAETDLKLLLDRVAQAPELSPGLRSQLRNRLQDAIREAGRRVAEVEAERLEQAERTRAAEEQRLMIDRLVSKEQRIKQLMERMNSLLSERRYQDAEIDAARIAYALDPTSPVTSDAVQFSRVTGFVAENLRIRDKHFKALVDSLALVDQANIPFVDEPPIVYPSADVWLDLTRRRAKYKAVDLSSAGPAEERIYKALDNETELDFTDLPLKDALGFIKDKHGIEIQLDDKALTDQAIPTDTPVTINVKGITLRSALRLMLRKLQLTYIVRDEVLLVTTQTEADNKLVVKVYPVADLVLPVNAGGGINPFSLGGGGLGGGLGGLGGGLGGGGLGGGGFGGGGFGGGGFGGGGLGGGGFGGAFNVLDEEEDDSPNSSRSKTTTLAKKPLTITEKPDGRLSTEQPVEKKTSDKFHVELNLAPGANLDAAWDDYFKTLDARAGIEEITKPADRFYRAQEVNSAVRDAARRLMKEQKFQEVAAMIQAALRYGYAQPWMYEGLGLAMQAADQPKSEIERALMSAVDFATSTDELMHVALYMSRIGLDKRALKLFRQAASIEPTRYEPYMHALAIAERTGDLDAIRWTCAGVLSRAWSNDKLEVLQRAKNLATSTLERLQKEKKTEQAKSFEAAINEALVRDLVVSVSWTGEADIDLVAEEPTGTVCSLQNPRTIAGGTLLANTSTQTSDKTGHREVYVVPSGFTGDYRLLVRRVWGKVTADKVTVDILSHYGTKRAEHQQKQIPLGDKDALVAVHLKDGRRTEPLAQAQVAVAANNQRAMGRAILAQQLDTMSDSSAIRDLAAARQLQQQTGLPFFRNGGAVGFMPIITTLPEGTNMSAVAVVSADRRYVRVSPTPLFSTIPEVNTFNFATGTGQNQQQGGLGGLGGGGLGGLGGGGLGGGGLGGGGFGGGGGGIF